MGEHPALATVLARGRALGFLGPGPIDDQISHARALGEAVDDWAIRALDLGAGGGLPGLVLAVSQPTSRWVLLDAHEGRTQFLRAAVDELGLEERVEVVRERAETLGRRAGYREAFAVVTARGFGPPAATAECGSVLLTRGGRLVVSEPPGGDVDRWPTAGLGSLGLRLLPDPAGRGVRRIVGPGDVNAHVVVLAKVEPSPAWAPRRTGVPGKRPLF